MANPQKVIHGLSNSAIFNEREPPQTQILRSDHSLTLNISEMAKDTAIVTISLCSALPYGRFPSSLTPSRPVLGGHL